MMSAGNPTETKIRISSLGTNQKGVQKHGSHSNMRTKVHRFMKRNRQLSLLMGSMLSALASAIACSAAPEAECLYWAEIAASEANVPPALMKAITTVESGRGSNGRLTPWPWTLNFQGKGVWLATRDEAQDHIASVVDYGSRNIDIGCFQLNLRWHGQHFASASDMLEPSTNARYAAAFLRSLYREFGSWDAAAKAFHSRTPEYAEKYGERLEPILRQYGGSFKSKGSQPRTLARQKAMVPAKEAPSSPGTQRAIASLVPANFQNPARSLPGIAR